ncbi:MAG: MerR family transcriptional regulator [Acidobacteriota bacterium]
MFRIGVFSKMNRVTIKTLRYYDEIGLLSPGYVDSATGYRYYSSDQLPRLHRIMALKQVGFSLGEINALLEKEYSTEEMISYLTEKQSEITSVIEGEQQKLGQIESYLKILRQEAFDIKHDVIIKELPAVTVACMRRVIANYDEFNQMYPEMGGYMMDQKLKCAVPEYCFSIYHDGEYKERDIDVEICQAVMAAGTDTEVMKFKNIEAVSTAACIFHKGPYTTIGTTYAAVMKWIDENGCKIIDNPRESYIDGIWNKENPEEWMTEIQIPIKRL